VTNRTANATTRTSTPTIEDVAREAKVSTATVSRALNQPNAVRSALREKVLAAVARLGYVPHAGARALSLRRSGTVGAIVPTIDNAIFASGLQAFQRRMSEGGYHVLLAFSDYDPDQEQAQVENLFARGVDAVALTGLSQRPALMERLRHRALPWVHTGSFPAPAGLACVGIRNRAAMMRAVRYLLDLGHRKVALLAGITRDNDRAAERARAVIDALALAKPALQPVQVLESRYELQSAREATRRLLGARKRPTAVLCGNDVLAYGVLLECQAQRVAVPGELSVIGFDDLDLSRHWQPALTTMHVPTERMWTGAADYLLARLRSEIAEPVQVEIDVELVVRESAGPPPQRRSGRR
jgi:LacI family transcriptional regulator